MATNTTKASIAESRHQELKAMLEERRLELVRDVHAKIRDARAKNTHEHNVLDEGETSDIDIQEEIGFALIQLKSETLDRINRHSGGSMRAPTAAVSSAVTRLPNHASRPFPLQYGARNARRAMKWPSAVRA